jgi:hypothetical protein
MLVINSLEQQDLSRTNTLQLLLSAKLNIFRSNEDPYCSTDLEYRPNGVIDKMKV